MRNLYCVVKNDNQIVSLWLWERGAEKEKERLDKKSREDQTFEYYSLDVIQVSEPISRS